MKNAPRAVVFDAVGTLLVPVPGVGEAYRDGARRLGLELDCDEIARRFRLAFTRQEGLDRLTGGERTSPERERERWSTIVAETFSELGTHPERAQELFEALWDHFALPAHWRLAPGAAEVWDTLHARGYRLGIASNFDSRLRRVCAGLPPLDGARLFVSAELGIRKPHADFFRQIERALEIPPAEMLLVGDDWENDYQGALAAGWQAMLILDRARSDSRTVGDCARSISRLLDLLHYL